MRLFVPRAIVVVALCLYALPVASDGTDTATAALTMSATVRSRTSLSVSSSELRFTVLDSSSASPTVFVDFTAAARARADADVVLTVAALDGVQTPGGGRSPDLVVAFQGQGANAGTLTEGMPQVVGAWKGSGMHAGQLSFTLRGATVAGNYVLPVKFVLSAP